MGKAVATTADSLPTERPSWMKDNSTRGNEGVTADDMAIPRLAIIQDLSPQHKKSKEEYIDGAEVKMVFNTATGELYPEGCVVVPVMFRKEWVIWKDIDSGGGFRGAFGTVGEAKAALAEVEDANDCEVVDTHQHFVLVLNEALELVAQAVISMSKSQMKVSRKWNTTIQTLGGDRFERAYKLSVVDDQNSAGQDFYNWKLTQLGFVTEEVFSAAEAMYEAVASGAMDVKRDQDHTPESGHAEGDSEADEEF